MEALVFVGGPTGVKLTQCPIPKIVQPNSVLVKVKAAGVCGTDLSVIKGTFPIPLNTVLGHEASGVVEQIGRPNLCKKGGISFAMGLSSVDGALTDYVVMPEDLLHKLPDDLALEKAVLCETMSTVIRGVDQMKPLDKLKQM